MTTCNTEMVDQLLNDYPYLAERAIVDFMNGFDVRGDQGSENEKLADSSFLTRMLDNLSGKKDARQVMYDRSAEGALVFIRDYILENERRGAENSAFIAEIADGIRLLSGKVRQLDGVVAEVLEALDSVDHRLAGIESRLDDHDLFNQAQSELRNAMSIFARGNRELSPEQALWFMLCRLKYGAFGTWLKRELSREQHKQVGEALDTLRNEALKILNELTGRHSAELMTRDELFMRISSQHAPVQEALRLTASEQRFDLGRVINGLNTESTSFDLTDVPYVFSNNSLYDQLCYVLTSPEGASNAISH